MSEHNGYYGGAVIELIGTRMHFRIKKEEAD